MKVIDCTTRQAGECADALRKLVADPSAILDVDGGRGITVRDQFALSDLLVALEDAERSREPGVPVAKPCPDNPERFYTEIGGEQ